MSQSPSSNHMNNRRVKVGMKIHSKPNSMKIHSKPNGEDYIMITTPVRIQEPARKNPTTHLSPPAVKHDRTRWPTRRHSFCVPNAAPPKQPRATGNGQIPVRRNSVGLVPPSGAAFPATMMFSKMVSHLEGNLESSRHFYHLQRFSNCFWGHRMVNCLLAYCVAFLNSCITKDQAIEMCKRLLAQGVIENVSHLKQQDMEGMVFKCSRLYRFTGNHFWENYIKSELVRYVQSSFVKVIADYKAYLLVHVQVPRGGSKQITVSTVKCVLFYAGWTQLQYQYAISLIQTKTVQHQESVYIHL